MKPLLKSVDKPLARVRAEDIAACQTQRLADGVSHRSINVEIGNIEIGVLREVLNRIAKKRNFKRDSQDHAVRPEPI
jgi:hypothetical protein